MRKRNSKQACEWIQVTQSDRTPPVCVFCHCYSSGIILSETEINLSYYSLLNTDIYGSFSLILVSSTQFHLQITLPKSFIVGLIRSVPVTQFCLQNHLSLFDFPGCHLWYLRTFHLFWLSQFLKVRKLSIS